MSNVRVIVVDVPGLEASVAVDKDGTIWVVIDAAAPRPYHVWADLMEDFVGDLPDRLTYDAPRPPGPPGLRLVS